MVSKLAHDAGHIDSLLKIERQMIRTLYCRKCEKEK
jgi:hypothetical protein